MPRNFVSLFGSGGDVLPEVGGPTIFRSDNFNRENGAIGTPSDAGSAWVIGNQTWVVVDNQGNCSAFGNNGFVYLDSGQSDCAIVATIVVSSGDGFGFCFRIVDSENLYRLRCGADSGGIQIQKVQAAAEVTIGTPWAGTIAAGDKIAVVLSGATIEGWHFTSGAWNLRTSGSNAFQQTEINHGFWSAFAQDQRYDDFEIRSAL